MNKIVLISCGNKKLSHKAKAKELYISPLFKFSWRYAEKLTSQRIYILSAKYGLLSPDAEIEPYNLTLNSMSSLEVEEWANRVLNSLKQEANLVQDEFIILAGERYRKYLIPSIKHYEIPMQGLPIGKQEQFLKNKLNNI